MFDIDVELMAVAPAGQIIVLRTGDDWADPVELEMMAARCMEYGAVGVIVLKKDQSIETLDESAMLKAGWRKVTP